MALLSNFLYWTITFCSVDKINSLVFKIGEKRDVNNTYSNFATKILAIFGGSIFTTLLASSIVYPFDTIKKKLQVNGAFGFQQKYASGKECIVANLKDFKILYRYLQKYYNN